MVQEAPTTVSVLGLCLVWTSSWQASTVFHVCGPYLISNASSKWLVSFSKLYSSDFGAGWYRKLPHVFVNSSFLISMLAITPGIVLFHVVP